MSYICRECGERFDKPVHHNESYGSYDESPCCGSTFTAARPCSTCGKEISAEDVYALCDSCKGKAENLFKRLLRENFTPEELEYLSDWSQYAYLSDIARSD